MFVRFDYVACGVAAAILLIGCQKAQQGVSQTATHQHANGGDDERTANLAKLSDDDRRLAVAQGYCAVSEEPLGSMGPPLKLIINEKPAFICCQGCEAKALANPDATLAKVAELQAKVTSEQGH